MQFVTNHISVGKPKSFDDIVAEYKRSKGVVKTASSKNETVKVAKEEEQGPSSGQPEAEGKKELNNDPYEDPKVTAESEGSKSSSQDEADSSGQLKVEPLHQEGESTTLPKDGPSGKKDASDEDKKVKIAEKCEGCGNEECTCEDNCECKSCMAKTETTKEVEAKEENQESEEKEAETEDKEDKEDKEAEATEEKEKEEVKKEAKEKVKFVKIANLDSKSKAWLNDYWKNLYPAAYVDAMLSDK
jgi:hypothetical protein